MRNFLCYRENTPVLDFENIHIACLCGDNGSGKSSIFDAITWALWGEASRGKSNDDLIYASPNINEMEVELEFLSGRQRYRVIRKHVRSTATKSGQSLLELQSYKEGTFRSLSEHTKMQTQAKILDLLHLDYQTFINSAMILQGRANEFSNKRPGERKEILANILDLSFYDQLEQQARESAEEKRIQAATLEHDIEAFKPKLDEKPAIEKQLNSVSEHLQEIEQAQKSLENDLMKLRTDRELLIACKKQLELLLQQIKEKKNNLQMLEQRKKDAEVHIALYSKLIAESEEIEYGYSEFKKILGMDEELNEKLKKSHDLVQRKNKLEGLINAAHNTYNNERKILANRLAELNEKYGSLPQLRQQHQQLLQNQKVLENLEAEIDVKKKQYQQLINLVNTLGASNSELNNSMEELNRKSAIMLHAAATCPLCESELGPDGRARIVQKLSNELEQKKAQLADNSNKIARYKNEAAFLEKELTQKESYLKVSRDSIKQKLAIKEKEIQDAEVAEVEITSKQPALQKLEEDIKNRNYAPSEQKALEAIEQELKLLDYDPLIHKQIAERKSKMKVYDERYQRLSEARLQYNSQQKAKLDSQIEIDEINSAIEKLEKQRIEIEQKAAGLTAITNKISDLENKQNGLAIEERKIRDSLAEGREKLKQVDLLFEEKQNKEKLLVQCREDASLFGDLAKCFSKKGIQALIIAETLPEIENEANLLLQKMTDNRMSLTLETQRDTKKGDIIETLDIKISDELGTRTYDMYSGGESFRIDLALRIAISRLLVRRVGAAMPILIIDEGFGTQDAAGLEKLVEAINAIQDDFEKVFIITHLEELKDKFPVIINVAKSVDGSLITINQ